MHTRIKTNKVLNKKKKRTKERKNKINRSNFATNPISLNHDFP